MLLSLTTEQLDGPRRQFNEYQMNVRGFICHAIQNTIYKNGQFASLYFALGYDGTDKYTAPYPNEFYNELKS